MMILSSSRLIHASSGGIRFVQPTAELQQTKQVAGVPTAKRGIAAATYRIWLRISTYAQRTGRRPQKLSITLDRAGPPHRTNAFFLGPTRVHTVNGTSIGIHSFCRAHNCDQHTQENKYTNHAISVTTGRLYAPLPEPQTKNRAHRVSWTCPDMWAYGGVHSMLSDLSWRRVWSLLELSQLSMCTD